MLIVQRNAAVTALDTNVAPPPILSASGNTIPVSDKGRLQPSTSLSKPAQAACVLEDLKTGSLILLCQHWALHLVACRDFHEQQSYQPG